MEFKWGIVRKELRNPLAGLHPVIAPGTPDLYLSGCTPQDKSICRMNAAFRTIPRFLAGAGPGSIPLAVPCLTVFFNQATCREIDSTIKRFPPCDRLVVKTFGRVDVGTVRG
jgi:hypothetical protein